MNDESKGLSFKEKAGYAGGDFASNLFWMTFIFYGTLYYTDTFGLTAAAVAAMFGIVRSFDSVAVFVAGIVADRTDTKWGKFRPFLIWLAIPYGIVGALCFLTPGIADSGKLVYAYATYLGFGLLYAAINIPYSSLLGVISSDPIERASASQFRFVGAFSAGAVIAFLLPSLVKMFGHVNELTEPVKQFLASEPAKQLAASDQLKQLAAGEKAQHAASSQHGYLYAMGLFAVLSVVLWFVTFATTKERVKPSATQESSLLKDIKSIVTNVPWLILFLLGLFTLSYVSMRNATAAYYIKYYVGARPLFGSVRSVEALMGWFNGVGMIAAIVGTIILTGTMTKKMGKKFAYVALMGISATLTIAYYWIPPDAVITIFVLQTLVSVFMGPTTPLVFAMYADAVDYSEWKDGRRATGLVMSASSLAQSVGWTVGGMLGGALLAAFGYQANVNQTPETLDGLKLMMSWIPAIGAVLATVAMLVYPLSEKRMQEIVSDLEIRRKKEQLQTAG
jgi:glycoside/pentoside/hexuronide:cation symporter, GPH family